MSLDLSPKSIPSQAQKVTRSRNLHVQELEYRPFPKEKPPVAFPTAPRAVKLAAEIRFPRTIRFNQSNASSPLPRRSTITLTGFPSFIQYDQEGECGCRYQPQRKKPLLCCTKLLVHQSNKSNRVELRQMPGIINFASFFVETEIRVQIEPDFRT